MDISNVRLSFLALSCVLASCGGGSAATTPTVTPNRAPTVDAGLDQSVDELSTVTLDGSGSSDPDNDSLTYSWTQTGGANVTLSSSTAVQPSFDAPDVTAIATPTTLTFELSVSDSALSANATVDIVVNDVGLGINSAPVAAAGADAIAAELTTVGLDGSGSSDPDGDTLSFAWIQTAGPSVLLSGADTGTPSFPAPDVTTPTVFTFQLTVNDGIDTAVDAVSITVQEGLTQVSIAGVLRYEFVPSTTNSNTCFGLDFSAITAMPIRAATVQLLDAGDVVLGQTVSGDDGSYSFANIDASTDVRVRVRAELKQSGAPNWDVEVRDNVDVSATPVDLGDRPLYVAQWALFDSGVANISNADFTAETGWDGSAYSGDRVAAPFAILDAIYSGMTLILDADATVGFAPLDAFWSVNNTRTEGSPTDIDMGELGGSFYRSDIDSLFLMGDASVNTGEFDNAVTVHEWGHYFEDNLSRSDSIGGRHVLGEVIDARLAFGEGWGHAVAAMALDDPLACNTGAVSGAGSFGFNIETFNVGPQGWYNEVSVADLILDLYNDVSIGFDPIYDVMTGPQISTEAFTTLFSFATLLRTSLAPADQAFLDTLLAAKNTETAGLDIWASTQGNINVAPNNARDVLPLYTDYTPGTTLNICTNDDHDPDGDGNKPAEHRYLRITTTAAAAYDITIVPDTIPPATTDPAPTPPDVIRDRSDPDFLMLRDGVPVAGGFSGVADSETIATQVLPADVYSAYVQEFRFGDEDKSSDFPNQICFDFTMTAQ